MPRKLHGKDSRGRYFQASRLLGVSVEGTTAMEREPNATGPEPSSLRDPVSEFGVSVRLVLVASVCAVATLGNLVILAILTLTGKARESHCTSRCRVIDSILSSLATTALCRALLLGPVQAACFIRGEWPFGNSVCQLQAYVEAMLKNVIPWYLGLLSIERYTKHLVPHEYLVTFTPLTVNIIIPGILLVVIVQVTGPLYGWGKYVYIHEAGLCGIATTSNFGCSYSLYLLCSLTLPSLSAIVITWMTMAWRLSKKTATEPPSKCMMSSRMLTGEKEVPSFVALMALFLLLSIPRCVLDAVLMCNCVGAPPPGLFFTTYMLDATTNLLLPVLCLGMHPKARSIACALFHKEEQQVPN